MIPAWGLKLCKNTGNLQDPGEQQISDSVSEEMGIRQIFKTMFESYLLLIKSFKEDSSHLECAIGLYRSFPFSSDDRLLSPFSLVIGI